MSELRLLPGDTGNSRFTVGCDHREVNNRNPRLADLPRRAPDDEAQMRMDEGLAHEEVVFEQLCRIHKVVNLREHLDPVAATVAAMQRGDTVIVGPQLPDINHRTGRPDVLIRHGAAPLAGGKWAYLPVDVKNSKPLDGKKKATQWPVSTLDSPWLESAVDTGLGEGTTKDDHDLQLAHYWLMLADMGHAPDVEPIAGIIDVDGRLVWRLLDGGKNSALATCRAEWIARWGAIAAMREDADTLTRPVYRTECKSCPWHDVCKDDLVAEQHVSLLPEVGVVAVRKLGEFGISNIPHLASLDHSLVGTDKLPAYAGLSRDIDTARVHMFGGNRPFLQRGQAMPRVPRADIEIDFDVENDDVLYLLGNCITVRQPDGTYSAGEYKSFHYFDRTDPEEEGRQLAAFWSWLHGMVDDAHTAGKSIAVYCYSGGSAEIPRMKEASARNAGMPGVPTPDEVAQLATRSWWVDLLPIAKALHWPTAGRGLKEVAKLAGFSWDADDAGGGNSIVWYRGACDPFNPEAAQLQHKLLRYNQDDVRATLHLRNWLTEGIEGTTWKIQPVEVLPSS